MIQKNKIEWRDVGLQEIAEISGGGTPSRTKDFYWGGEIPWIKISDLKDFHVTKYDESITEEGLKNSSAKVFPKGTILVSIFASLGDVAILDLDATTNQAIAGVYNLKVGIKREYLALYLRSLKRYFESIGRGVAQSNINLSILRKTKIPLPFSNGQPDLKEQKRIVSILEKAEKLKEQSKNAEKLLDEYLKSVFNEMFVGKGFGEMKISEGILKTYNENPLVDFSDNTFYYVDIASIDSRSKKIVHYNKLFGKEAPSRARQQIKKNDVLVSTVRPNLNSVSLVPENLDNQICSTGFCILRADNKNFVPEYLFYTSQAPSFVDSLVKKCKGANYPGVSNEDIKSLKIPLPSLPIQQKFASIVEQVEKMKEEIKKTQKNSEELFDSLMNKAFRGEL